MSSPEHRFCPQEVHAPVDETGGDTNGQTGAEKSQLGHEDLRQESDDLREQFQRSLNEIFVDELARETELNLHHLQEEYRQSKGLWGMVDFIMKNDLDPE